MTIEPGTPIPPDTKDWTWVLERPCPDCGFDATTVLFTDIPRLIDENAAGWETVLERPDVRDRPAPNVWSPLEYACHVRDVFRLYDIRLGLMVDQDDPQFPNWDQDETAINDRYGEQDPAVVRADLVGAAAVISRSLAAVTDDQLDRRGRRSDGAGFTIDTFGRYFIHDPIHHIWDVRAGAPA